MNSDQQTNTKENSTSRNSQRERQAFQPFADSRVVDLRVATMFCTETILVKMASKLPGSLQGDNQTDKKFRKIPCRLGGWRGAGNLWA